MDRGTWRNTVHGVAKSQTRLSDKHRVGIENQATKIIWDETNQSSEIFKVFK